MQKIPELVQVEIELFEDKAKTTFEALIVEQNQGLVKQFEKKQAEIMGLMHGIEQDIPTLEDFVKQRVNDITAKSSEIDEKIMMFQGYNTRIEHKIDLLTKTLDEEVISIRK